VLRGNERVDLRARVLQLRAPDDGNMTVLAKVATPAQQARWLAPIVDGRVRSAFVMTEPHPGSGSDPAMMLTRPSAAAATGCARPQVVHHRREAAQHFILIAKTSDDPRKGLSAFMFDRDQPGWRIVRRIPIMDPRSMAATARSIRRSSDSRPRPAHCRSATA
jgi:acyl-CoA dehydrogenase